MSYSDYDAYDNFNFTDLDDELVNVTFNNDHHVIPEQIFALVCYSVVLLLGVPGNAVVLWVTGFCMPRSVTSLWFLNLALADLLCCLSLPLLMTTLAYDDEWFFGALACKIIKPTIYVMMLCSVLQLVVISLDRWMMVSRPVWCQNNRRPRRAAVMCVVVWVLAVICSLPYFFFTALVDAGTKKKECLVRHQESTEWIFIWYNFLLGFLVPLLVILVSHYMVYRKAESGRSGQRKRSRKTLKIIVAVVLSFFFCWFPLHMVNFILPLTPNDSSAAAGVYLSHVLTLCLAYFNSCLNPLLYVCIGRGFKSSVNRSLRHLLQFVVEDTSVKMSVNVDINETKTSSLSRDVHKL